MTSPEIILVPHSLPPEASAMVQAMYSRSAESVTVHLKKVEEVGPEKFMSQYYVGYGHESIGDCGSIIICVENVSMLVAKAIQDHPLYNGQEASTRFLDFAEQPFVDPYDADDSRAVLDGWRALYVQTLDKLKAAVKAAHPYDAASGKPETVWENACNARAFDIARGLLPLGATTFLSWTTSLRNAREKLRDLKWHPLPEVREVARQIYAALLKEYPSSFNSGDMWVEGEPVPSDANRFNAERQAARDGYISQFSDEDNYQDAAFIILEDELSEAQLKDLRSGKVLVDRTVLDVQGMQQYGRDALVTRPPFVRLHRRFKKYGAYRLSFLLDFGSFRDIQRQRNGLCMIPLTDNRFGMNSWYLNQMESLLGDGFAAVQKEIDRLLQAVEELYQSTDDSGLTQYYYPLGMNVLVQLVYDIPQMIYVAELRSPATVHGSLRPIAWQMGDALESDFPGISLKIDRSPDQWSLKRGTQTITKVA